MRTKRKNQKFPKDLGSVFLARFCCCKHWMCCKVLFFFGTFCSVCSKKYRFHLLCSPSKVNAAYEALSNIFTYFFSSISSCLQERVFLVIFRSKRNDLCEKTNAPFLHKFISEDNDTLIMQWRSLLQCNVFRRKRQCLR